MAKRKAAGFWMMKRRKQGQKKAEYSTSGAVMMIRYAVAPTMTFILSLYTAD